MVDIQAKEIIDKIFKELKIQPALTLPRRIGDRINLVYVVNPETPNIQVALGNASDSSASVTIFTTHATKPTFLTGLTVTIAKSSLATATSTDVRFTPIGKAQATGLRVRYEPSTAGQFTETLSLNNPIELEPGTTVNFQNDTAIASIDVSATAFFYEVDPL